MSAGHPTHASTDVVGLDSDVTMAGFIVWLSRQRVPDVRRYRTHDEIDRFLRWCNVRPGGRVNPRAAAWNYLTEMRAAGLSEVMVADIWSAIGLFLDYWEQRTPVATRLSQQPSRPVGM